jgi:hypothetical protein
MNPGKFNIDPFAPARWSRAEQRRLAVGIFPEEASAPEPPPSPPPAPQTSEVRRTALVAPRWLRRLARALACEARQRRREAQ